MEDFKGTNRRSCKWALIMQGIAKGVLISIIVSIALMMLTSFIYFFPWYTTLLVETFNVSQIVAGDNYLKETYYEDTLDRLKDKPIYNKNPEDIEVVVKNEDGRNAIGDDDETIYANSSESYKPYKQRGSTLEVELKAIYPLQVQIWGETYTKEIPVSFSMKTVGLKHYKDLDYYFN